MLMNTERFKQLNILAYIISAIVLLVVVFMRRIHIESSIDFRFLPAVYSLLNVISGSLLIGALVAIKKKNISLHRKLMTVALIISFLFLLMYVVYHITTPETKFCREGFIRTIYFFILITHVVLAAISFPFILFTYIKGLSEMFDKHQRMARWVFPIWLYVCWSGPVCYILLFPCYQ